MQSFVLKNGLRLILYPVATAHSVSVGLYLGAGSARESLENNGISHVLEHMFFRRAGEYSQDDLYYLTECMGTSLDAATGKEMIRFLMKIRPRFFAQSLKIIANIMAKPRWTDEQFRDEKRTVLNELREDNYSANVGDYSAKTVWKKSALSLPVLGTRKTLNAMTLKDLFDFRDYCFRRNNLVLVVTGAVPEDSFSLIGEMLENIPLTEEVEDGLAGLSASACQFNRKPDIKWLDFDYDNSDIRITFDADMTRISEEELLFFSGLFGGGGGSLLYRHIADSCGLSYNPHSNVLLYKGAAVLCVSLSVAKREVLRVQAEIISVLNGIRKGISPKQIDMNMPYFTDNYWFWLDENEILNKELGWSAIRGKPLYTLEEVIKTYRAMTAERMTEIAEILFQIQNVTVTILGPKTSAVNEVRQPWKSNLGAF